MSIMNSRIALVVDDEPSHPALSPISSNHQAFAACEKIPAKQTIGAESASRTRRLQGASRETAAAAIKRPNGWTLQRRARQAALIRRWAPWRRSTGPRTEAGKARCAKNPLKHGFASRATVQQLRRVRHALRLAARNTTWLRLLIRISRLWVRLRLKYKSRRAALSALRASPGAHPRLKLKFRHNVRCGAGRIGRNPS